MATESISNNKTYLVKIFRFLTLWIPIFILMSVLAWMANFLLEIYTSEIHDPSKYNYYGTLGDFMGGLMNPILSFITVVFLLITIRQNQATIKINSEELKLTRKELNHSQKALTKDALTNSLKFHFEIIELIGNQMKSESTKNIFSEDMTKFSFIEQIMKKDPIDGYDEYRIQIMQESITHGEAGFDTFFEIIQVYETFLDSVKIIISHLPSFGNYFRQHDAVKLVFSIDEMLRCINDFTPPYMLENAIENTKLILEPKK